MESEEELPLREKGKQGIVVSRSQGMSVSRRGNDSIKCGQEGTERGGQNILTDSSTLCDGFASDSFNLLCEVGQPLRGSGGVGSAEEIASGGDLRRMRTV